MLKQNSKYTAKEIIDEIGIETFQVGEENLPIDQIWNKYRVSIGGLRGIVSPDHVIGFGDNEEVEIIIGAIPYKVNLVSNDEGEQFHSEGAKASYQVEGLKRQGFVEHEITEEDLKNNPGMDEDLKVGDKVFLPPADQLQEAPEGFVAPTE